MRISPRLVAATLVIAIGGVTSGALIGQTPMLEKTGIGGNLPELRGSVDVAPRTVERAPNQYAIETPEGRFEIAELSSRGVYRNRSRSYYDTVYEAEMAALDAELDAQWEPDPAFADGEWDRAPRARREPGDTRIELAATHEHAPASGDSASQVTVTRPEAEPMDPVAEEPYTAL